MNLLGAVYDHIFVVVAFRHIYIKKLFYFDVHTVDVVVFFGGRSSLNFSAMRLAISSREIEGAGTGSGTGSSSLGTGTGTVSGSGTGSGTGPFFNFSRS